MLASVLNIDLRIFGYDAERNSNQLTENLIQKIIHATDAETIFYENIMSAVSNSLAKIKQQLL